MASKFFGLTVAGYYGQRDLDVPDKVGLEIEMEGVGNGGFNPKPVEGWVTHDDGSLRGGIEYVSNGPRTPAQVVDDLARLREEFERINFVPVFSFRTSLHVHVNVRDLTWLQVFNLWTLYTIFESMLIDIGGEERKGNVHCISACDAEATVNSLRQLLSRREINIDVAADYLQRVTSRDRRYAAFNWASIPQFGTVEFRSHRGTMDQAAVVNWVNTLIELKRAAKMFDNPQDVVTAFSSAGLEQFSRNVFGDNHPVTTMINSYSSDVWEAVRLVQEVAFCRKDWVKDKRQRKKREPQPELQVNIVPDEEGEIRLNVRDIPWQNLVPQPHLGAWNEIGAGRAGPIGGMDPAIERLINEQMLAARRRAERRNG